MTVLPVLAVGILMNLVAVLFVLVSLVLILLILVQKGRGGGLSAAFGGGMASGLLGSKTGDFLTWATITVVSIFLVLAVVLARYYRPSTTNYDQASQTSQPATTSAPSQPSTETPQPVPQESTPAVPPSGASTGAAAPQAQPPAPQPGAATTPTPGPNGVGG